METTEAVFNIQNIGTFISSVGFPIFMAVMLFNYMKTEQEQMRRTIEDLKEAITVLTERLGGDYS